MPHYARVNAQMLPEYRGKTICLLGKLNKISQDEMSLEVMAADSKLVQVKLKIPIRDMLTDVVEIYGSVDAHGNVICTNYATFDQSLIRNFDMDLYNETLQMAYQLPKHFVQAE